MRTVSKDFHFLADSRSFSVLWQDSAGEREILHIFWSGLCCRVVLMVQRRREADPSVPSDGSFAAAGAGPAPGYGAYSR